MKLQSLNSKSTDRKLQLYKNSTKLLILNVTKAIPKLGQDIAYIYVIINQMVAVEDYINVGNNLARLWDCL